MSLYHEEYVFKLQIVFLKNAILNLVTRNTFYFNEQVSRIIVKHIFVTYTTYMSIGLLKNMLCYIE